VRGGRSPQVDRAVVQVSLLAFVDGTPEAEPVVDRLPTRGEMACFGRRRTRVRSWTRARSARPPVTTCACGSVAPALPMMDPEFTFSTDELEAWDWFFAWRDDHRDHRPTNGSGG